MSFRSKSTDPLGIFKGQLFTIALLLALLMNCFWSHGAAAQVTLTAESLTRSNMCLFHAGESITFQFSATGVTNGWTLAVTITNQESMLVSSQSYPVTSTGNWTQNVTVPNTTNGLYRVFGTLLNSNTVEATLPAVGSRPAGFVTYGVVPDPRLRPAYSEFDSIFGMQGGFNSAAGTDLLPFLGVRWSNNGGWGWAALSPSTNDIFNAQTSPLPAPADNWSTNDNGTAWVVYNIPNLTVGGEPYGGNPCVYKPGTFDYNTGALLPQYYPDWSNFCTQVALAWPKVYPQRLQPIYEVTWEPVSPWGYGGSNADLVTLYQLAYSAIHAVSTNALVMGPCMFINSSPAISQSMGVFQAGLSNYIDAFSAHPYMMYDLADSEQSPWMDPELAGQPCLLDTMRIQLQQSMGREVPMLGTEQGYNTRQNTSNEFWQAKRLIRSNLITVGEGWRVNLAFYAADYYSQDSLNNNWYWDWGFFYNLATNDYGGYAPSQISPKPVAAAYSAMTFLIDGRASVCDINWLRDTTRGYAYQSYTNSNDVVLALWDFSGTPHPTTISVGTNVSSVCVYDWMGNATTNSTPGGSLTVTLTDEPTYIAGVSPNVWGAARPDLNVALGKTVTVSSTADPTNYPGSMAVDGDNESYLSRWLSVSGISNEHWIAVNLGGNYPVNEVRFWTGQYLAGYDNNTYQSPLTAYNIQSSPDGVNWSNLVSVTGNTKAVVDDTFSTVTTSHIRLDVPPWQVTQVMLYEIEVLAADVPPTVSLTAPTQGQNFTAPASINLQAIASDTAGTITLVQFFQGTNKLGQATSSPYTCTWSNAPAGNYSLTAVATDSYSLSSTSAVVNVTVNTASGAITVTNPTGSSTPGTGDWFPVYWTSTGTVNNVNVTISTNNQVSWILLATNVADSGSCGVYMPGGQGSSSCYVRVQDVSGSPTGLSPMFTLDSIIVTSPNGGQNWTVGANATVTWTAFAGPSTVNILLSINGGTTWTNLVTGVSNNGSYTLTVPNMPSTTCRISVQGPYGTPKGTSAANFTIAAATGAITVTNPTGSSTPGTGDWFPVDWTSTGTVNNVNVSISTNNAVSWISLASNATNSGTCGVYMPGGQGSSNCYIQVQGVSGSPTGTSPMFTLDSIIVISPNGGEKWTHGGNATVTWSAFAGPSTANILLSTNGGSTWTNLATGVSNNGSYGVTVPNTTSTTCRVSVQGPYGTPKGTSAANFTIQ